MIIYGVALLAACMLAGNVIGELIGIAIGVDSNVGGVGLAMLLLVFAVSFALVPVIAHIGQGKYAVPLDDLENADNDREARDE